MKQMFKNFKEFLGILFDGLLIFSFVTCVCFWFGGCYAVHDAMGSKKYFDVKDMKVDVDSIYTFSKLSAFGFVITCIYLLKIALLTLSLLTVFLLTRDMLKYYNIRTIEIKINIF